MITLTAIAAALALGWVVRSLWRALVRAATPPVAGVHAEEIAR
jgi:hypothetical protein